MFVRLLPKYNDPKELKAYIDIRSANPVFLMPGFTYKVVDESDDKYAVDLGNTGVWMWKDAFEIVGEKP